VPDGTLIGREAEVEALISHLMGDTPVVLLTGPAGVGKSSVADVVAEGWSKGPVFICDLANCDGTEAIRQAIATALHSAATDDAIMEVFASRTSTLLVLDGADGALESVADRLPLWRAAAPETRFLITTRRRIPIPDAVPIELAAMTEKDAVALFESRARRARPGFEVPGGKAPVLNQVIDRLDRMPEAIGLAADRMQVLSLDALDRRLAEPRIGVGAGSDPRGPMRKAFDSTWKGLDHSARLTLQGCAVFTGPFDATAAEAIIQLPEDGPSVPSALAVLENHSLISTEATDGSLVFWMLDAIRQFAASTLDASGEREAVEDRFVTWYAAFAGGLLSSASEGAPERGNIDRSWDNLMAAAGLCLDTRPHEAATLLAAVAPIVGLWRPIGPFLEVAQDADLDGDGELQGRLALAIARAAWRRGRAHDASRLLDGALRCDDLTDGLQAELLLERAMLAHRQGAADQRDSDLEDAMQVAGDERLVRGEICLAMAERALSTGDLRGARDHATDAAVLFEDEGDLHSAARAAIRLGQVVRAQGTLNEAQTQLELALEQFQRMGDKGSEAATRLELGRLALARQGDGIVAKGQLEAALDRAVALEDLELAGRCHAALALWALDNDDERATSEHVEGASYAHRRTSREGAAVALGTMGILESRRGRLGMAERRLSDATRTLEALGATRHLALYRAYQAWVVSARGDHDEARRLIDSPQGQPDHDGATVLRHVQAHLDNTAADDTLQGVHHRIVSHLSRLQAGDDTEAQEVPVVHVEREGRWFQVSDGPIAELGHRKPMRRILLGLARAREDTPGEGMSTEAIFATGWPGERATPDSARNRVYVTIRRLRSSGLQDALVSDDSGYFLSPAMRIKWTPGHTGG
jgi:predicted ATPase